MRLLRTYTAPWLGHEDLELLTFNRRIPKYAILSHVWGEDEVVFEHIRDGTARDHAESYRKIMNAMQQTANDGFEYMWIDSCCIDKSSSAELSEAINSMYTWYQEAKICYAILEDVPEKNAANFKPKFQKSKWFTRGWTLQELLAPKRLRIFGRDQTGAWTKLGSKQDLSILLSESTAIDRTYLNGQRSVHEASIAERMSWAAKRKTTRSEDVAYSLMGLFSVNMPMLYGEGSSRAFRRLQEEIMKISDDQSIFAWTESLGKNDATSKFEEIDRHRLEDFNSLAKVKTAKEWMFAFLAERGLLAESPKAFSDSGNIKPSLPSDRKLVPYHMTNRGLSISLKLVQLTQSALGAVFVAELDCALTSHRSNNDGRTTSTTPFGIYLLPTEAGLNQYTRIRCNKLALLTDIGMDGNSTELFVRQPKT